MILIKIIVVVVLLGAALGYAKHEHVYERIGVIGGCEVSAAPISDTATAQWWSCREGVLTGFPSLTRDNCRIYTVVPKRQLWRCPEAIARPSAL